MRLLHARADLLGGGAVGEWQAGALSAASFDAEHGAAARRRRPLRTIPISDAEIRERMSGNICRCGAYSNIVAAVRSVAEGKRA